jgi:glycosyltransferase involved in cell wall biosynthesis
MTELRKPASVIVTNHNYGRWLGEAIDSALAQDCEVEVIVVDDGSTDHSREVIASYGDRIRPVLQDNGGQAAALNAGFAASRGDPILFLDADDVLLESTVRRAAALLADDRVAQVHWPHAVIDEQSRPTGERFPECELPTGELQDVVARFGPGVLSTSPTSGNAFPRWLLEQLMPIRPQRLRMCADQFVTQLAPLFGRVAGFDEPQSLYRRHHHSGYASASFDRQLELGYQTTELLIEPCAHWCARLGLHVDPSSWRRNSWFHCLREVDLTLERLIAPGTPFILVDDGQMGMTPNPRRRVMPFPECDGLWSEGRPKDAQAIAALETQREAGAAYLAIVWFSRWWLDHYRALAAHLREHYALALEDELLTVFDLNAVSSC